MTLDGVAAEPEWARAVEVQVPLSYGNVSEVFLKAAYTNEEVFLLVRWPDPEPNREHHPWAFSSISPP